VIGDRVAVNGNRATGIGQRTAINKQQVKNGNGNQGMENDMERLTYVSTPNGNLHIAPIKDRFIVPCQK